MAPKVRARCGSPAAALRVAKAPRVHEPSILCKALMQCDMPVAKTLRVINSGFSATVTARSCQEEYRRFSNMETPYGKVATTLRMPLVDGTSETVYINNPFALLYAAAVASPRFAKFLVDHTCQFGKQALIVRSGESTTGVAASSSTGTWNPLTESFEAPSPERSGGSITAPSPERWGGSICTPSWPSPWSIESPSRERGGRWRWTREATAAVAAVATAGIATAIETLLLLLLLRLNQGCFQIGTASCSKPLSCSTTLRVFLHMWGLGASTEPLRPLQSVRFSEPGTDAIIVMYACQECRDNITEIAFSPLRNHWLCERCWMILYHASVLPSRWPGNQPDYFVSPPPSPVDVAVEGVATAAEPVFAELVSAEFASVDAAEECHRRRHPLVHSDWTMEVEETQYLPQSQEEEEELAPTVADSSSAATTLPDTLPDSPHLAAHAERNRECQG